jgi:hypothetical protein
MVASNYIIIIHMMVKVSSMLIKIVTVVKYKEII